MNQEQGVRQPKGPLRIFTPPKERRMNTRSLASRAQRKETARTRKQVNRKWRRTLRDLAPRRESPASSPQRESRGTQNTSYPFHPPRRYDPFDTGIRERGNLRTRLRIFNYVGIEDKQTVPQARKKALQILTPKERTEREAQPRPGIPETPPAQRALPLPPPEPPPTPPPPTFTLLF